MMQAGAPIKYSAVWNNKMMKNKFTTDRGIGSWSGNDPQDPVDPITNTEIGPPLEVYGANASEVENFNLNRVLLANIQRKRAKLAETEARLTNRLRWGIAVLQAKADLRAKRLAFVEWR